MTESRMKKVSQGSCQNKCIHYKKLINSEREKKENKTKLCHKCQME